MPLFRPNTVVLQPIFCMLTRLHVMHGKTDRNHGKIKWKNRWQLWVNQWTPWKNRLKPWKNRWAVQMGHFSSKIQQSTVFLLQNVASSKEKRPRLKNKKTRCSPRTRMLTRMLMVQMSKNMDMQSRRTLFWNSLFEQSCTFFPCYHARAP